MKEKTIILFLIAAVMVGALLVFRPFSPTVKPKIVKAQSGGALYQSAGSLPYSATFGSKTESNQAPTKITVGKTSITMTPETEVKEIKKQGSDQVVVIAIDGSKFIQTLKQTGIKEDIVIQKAIDQIVFTADLAGVTPRQVKDLWRFMDDQGQEQFFIPQPFMVDSKGARSEAVALMIVPGEGDNYQITITPDQDWLNDPARVYPITIDPSFEIQETPIKELKEKRSAKSKTYDNGDGTFTLNSWGGPVHYQDENGDWKDYDPKNPPEVVSKRTAKSKAYNNGDGGLIYNFWEAPVHYQDDKNKWQDIDTTLVDSTDPDYDLMNITNNTKTWFKTDAFADQDNVKLQKGDASVTFGTINKLTIKDKDKKESEYLEADLKPKNDKEKEDKKGQKTTGADNKENKVKYNEVFKKGSQKIDVSYTVLDFKLQEEIVLNEYLGFPEISQEITLTNAYAKVEGKAIVIYHQSTNELLWILPEPRMYEKENEEAINFGLHYDLQCTDNNLTIEQCNHLTLTKTFDQEGKDWLADPARVYPVVIDPDFVGSTDDGYVSGWDSNYYTAHSTAALKQMTSDLVAGQRISGSDYLVFRSFLKFDTSGIPDGDTVTQVNLKLTCKADYSTADFDIQIVKQDWSAQDPVTDGNMDTAYDNCLSGDADDSIWRNTSGMATNTQYTSGNLSTAWVNKAGDTYYSLRSNEDFATRLPSVDEWITLYDGEDETAAYRPVLTVTYTSNAAPTNDSLTFTNPSAGNSAVADNSTEWNFDAVVSDTDGYADLTTVELRMADSSDNATPYTDIEVTWTQATDTFAETGTDALSAATLGASSSSCAGNTCTLSFKIKFNTNFATQNTNYNAELYSIDDSADTDEDSYSNFYQLLPYPAEFKFKNIKLNNINIKQ